LWREARKFMGYFVWKITILRQQIIFFPILGGRRVRPPPPPGSTPATGRLKWSGSEKVGRNVDLCFIVCASLNNLGEGIEFQKRQFIRLFSNCLHYLFSSVTPLSILFQLYPGSRYFLVEDTGVPRDNHRSAASHWLFRLWRRKNNRLWQLWQMVSPKVWKPFKYSFFFFR
jgi:hypothetical protein